MQGGYGSLVGMDVGTKENGAKFIDNLKMLYHVANIGDARSLAIHPATTTHSQLNDKELASCRCNTRLCKTFNWYRASR